MNSLERVATILSQKEADRVPVYPILSGVTRKLTGATYKDWANNAEVCAESLIKAQEEFELDVICTLTDLSVEAGDYGQELVFPENEAAHPNYNNQMIKTPEDYLKLPDLDPTKTPRMSEHIKLCKILVERKGKTVPIVAFVFGPLGILSMLRGQEKMYMDIYDYPDKIKAALDKINQMLIKYCDALIQTGVHAIMLDTLFASKSIMSKKMWLEFEGVYVKELADFIHSKNCMVMVHNCGLGSYFDAQIETMQPEAISYLHVPAGCQSHKEAKELYGHKTTLIGNIPPTSLPVISREELIEACKAQLADLKPGGGFILATGCEYPANLSFDHARTMVECAKEYGKY